MTTVTVSTGKKYDVRIGHGLLEQLGEAVRELGNVKRVCIVSDSHVWPLYGQRVKHSLEDAGFFVTELVFPHGESSKNGENWLKIVNFFAQSGLTRTDVAVALGGGVTGDLTGFAAATFLRGIRYVQVPTTLLAAADSSVGGKTAIDLSAGKNLAGAFWQPSLVLCDVDTLDTLPESVLREGFAEVIKYGVLYDPEFFAFLETQSLENFQRERVIARCVELKRDAVVQDEFDHGARRFLNLGHTIGHAVEACSGFTVSHGEAVAVGMAMIARAAKCRDTERICALLKHYGLPVTTNYTPGQLEGYVLSDKKRQGDVVSVIIPRGIGDCECVALPVAEVKTLIREGM